MRAGKSKEPVLEEAVEDRQPRRPAGELLNRAMRAAYVLGAIVVLFFCWQLVEASLIEDPRFLLRRGSLTEAGTLMVEGRRYAPIEQLDAVFQNDYDRSIYMLDLARRRQELLRQPWIANATVSRVWPNRVLIRLEERRPSAWLHLVDEHRRSRPMILSDEEGKELPWTTEEARQKPLPPLPHLRGVPMGESAEDRKARVHAALAMLADLREFAPSVKEVDVENPRDLTILQLLNGRAVKLQIGDRNFYPRYRFFVESYSKIIQHNPEVELLDLRVDDKIYLSPAPNRSAPPLVPGAAVPGGAE
jgi:cell division protein FtsQ